MPTPVLVDAAANEALDAAVALITHLSLHDGDPGTTGANEISGGSPAYARESATWDPAASRQVDIATGVSFDVPASTTVLWVGMWSQSSGGTYYGAIPVGAGPRKWFNMPDATDDIIYSEAHGYSNGDTVVVFAGSGGLPGGLSEGTIYFIINANTNDFQLSETSGGGAVAITSLGDGFVQSIVPETFGSQGVLNVNSQQIGIFAA